MSFDNKIWKYFGRKLGSPPLKPVEERTKKWFRPQKRLLAKIVNFQGVENTKVSRHPDVRSFRTKWVFKVVAGIDQGREFVAATKEIQVGRHPQNLILLRDPKVSRFHAVFYYKGARLYVEDLGSTNGTRLNGEILLKKKQVFSGDQLKLGDTVIQISSFKPV